MSNNKGIKNRRAYFIAVMFVVYALYLVFFLSNFKETVQNFTAGNTNVASKVMVYGLFILMLALNLMSMYFLTYNLIGFKMPKKDYKMVPPKNKFLFLVFAHNEEAVIKSSVESILEVDYPKELFGVCVIADNCNDKTCDIIRGMNNDQIILAERHNKKLRGKQYAANWFVENYSQDLVEQGYDYVVFLDADNHVDKNFLIEINSDFEANKEAVVIQGYLGVKNPDSNYVSRGYASAYNVFNRFYQLGKRYVRVNSHIGGTGFAFDLKELSKIGWHTTSLTEDYEMMVKLTLENKLVLWNHWAAIYDEKPTQMKSSLIQRLRWVRGHWQVAFANFFPIVKSFGKVGLLNFFDMLSTAVTLGKSIIMLGGLLTGLVLFAITGKLNSLVAPSFLFLFSMVLLYTQSICVQMVDFKKSFWKSATYSVILLRDYLIYNLTFIPLHLIGLLSFKKKVWVRTEHTITSNDGIR